MAAVFDLGNRVPFAWAARLAWALPLAVLAQAPASLGPSPAGLRLTIPYLEVQGLLPQAAAFALALDSPDGQGWTVVPGSLLSLSLIPNADVRSTGRFTAHSSQAGVYRLTLPDLRDQRPSPQAPTTAYTLALDTQDVARFTLDLSSLGLVPLRSPPAAPVGLMAATTGSATVAGSGEVLASSTRLALRWDAPSTPVHHWRATATDGVQQTTVSASSTVPSLSLTGLKADTAYSVALLACGDADCRDASPAASASARTPGEVWQLQGSGNTTAGLTRLVSDGNVRISGTRIGPDAGTPNAGQVQIYYGPSPSGVGGLQVLSVGTAQATADAGSPASVLAYTSQAGRSGVHSVTGTSGPFSKVQTGQGVPLAAALGGGVRLFFEAIGHDNKARLYSLDSRDGWVGQDFHAGTPTVCTLGSEYAATGDCAVRLELGVEGDLTGANPKVPQVRQNKLGYPVLDDWRWNGEAGTFLVFTTDRITGCSASGMNHGYAVWSGSQWQVQYASNGCPKLFTSAQAAFPLHSGGVKYRLIYGDPGITTGKLSTSTLPFLGPKKVIYADGRHTGDPTRVEFEDWEPQSAARVLRFVWPDGSTLNDTAAGYIDDYHFLSPTGTLDFQLMLLAITNGTEVPISVGALLVNP